MKVILQSILVFYFAFCSINGYCQSKAYSIQRIELIDPNFKKAIEDYIKDRKEELQYGGVIQVISDPMNICYYFTYRMFLREIQSNPPSFFAVCDKKIVLIYTGFERQLFFDEKTSFKDLLRESKNAFMSPEAQISYDPVMWKITYNGQQYQSVRVDEIPWYK